jgi:flagellar basal body rod protein FlgC
MLYLKRQVIAEERTLTRVAALFLALLVIDLAGFALAAEETKVEEIIGRIISLDTTANMVTIQTKQGEMSFYVNEKTQITMAKEEMHFSDLRVGEKVKVHYIIAEGKELAERVMVKPRKEKGSPKGFLNP